MLRCSPHGKVESILRRDIAAPGSIHFVGSPFKLILLKGVQRPACFVRNQRLTLHICQNNIIECTKFTKTKPNNSKGLCTPFKPKTYEKIGIKCFSCVCRFGKPPDLHFHGPIRRRKGDKETRETETSSFTLHQYRFGSGSAIKCSGPAGPASRLHFSCLN